MKSSWDPVWETLFASRAWGKYPPEALVRFAARNFYRVPDRRAVRILDLGCGPGACTWYLAREGFSVAGIDGSPTAIRQTLDRLTSEGLTAELKIGDFLELPWPDGHFDGVVDVEALSSNTLVASRQVVREIVRVLRPGGLFFSISFRDGCWGDGLGRQIEEHTYDNIAEGPMTGMGVIRYSPEHDIRSLYADLDLVELECVTRTVANRAHHIAEWLVTCRKPL